MKRVDDGHEIDISSADRAVKPLQEGRTAYDAGYRRIVHEKELAAGRARIFETGGTFVLLVRNDSTFLAFDAQPLVQRDRMPHLVYTQTYTVENASRDGIESRKVQPLATATEDGWIWVEVEPVSR